MIKNLNIKKMFFSFIFFALYISFIAQFAYAILKLFVDTEHGLTILGLLSIEWLVIISARYLSKKSSASNMSRDGGGYHQNNNGFKR